MRTLTRNILLLCLIQCFCAETSATTSEVSEDISPRQTSIFASRETLSALKGPSQFKERALLCRSLDIPFEHIALSFSESPKFPYRFATTSSPEVSSFFFTYFDCKSLNSAPHLPINKGDFYEFHLHFSRAGQPFHCPMIFHQNSCCCSPPHFYPCGGDAGSLKRSEEQLRAWKKNYEEKAPSDPLLTNSDQSIPSNPFHISRQLDPRNRFSVSFNSFRGFMKSSACPGPDCVEILVHPRIKDFLTHNLRQENQRLLQQHQALSSSFDDMCVEFEDLKTRMRILTLQAAAERSFDSVTNTTVSSLRSSPQFSREESRNGTPTNDLEEPA